MLLAFHKRDLWLIQYLSLLSHLIKHALPHPPLTCFIAFAGGVRDTVGAAIWSGIVFISQSGPVSTHRYHSGAALLAPSLTGNEFALMEKIRKGEAENNSERYFIKCRYLYRKGKVAERSCCRWMWSELLLPEATFFSLKLLFTLQYLLNVWHRECL